MKKYFLFILITFASSILAPLGLFAQANGGETNGVERYAIFVGSNNGGKNNQRLLYAGTDAISFQKTMAEIGGIPRSNGILLLDPTKSDLDEAMQTVSHMISKNKQKSKRSEFLFYYSGHSDENSLLLGKSTYGYSNLKAAITNVPSDVHVVILDSCYSGNFIRTKGGQKKKPFLMDDSSVVKGHAYLSSSSSQEFSQESDEIGSSFFTNAIVTGLRGAADSSGDKKVTLNELYSYAFSETLSKTENSSAGPQHPNYNITLVGSGDLVLSDISNSDSIVMLTSDVNGRMIIRDKNGKLVSEINKTEKKPVYLALEQGEYSATLITKNLTMTGTFALKPGKMYELSSNSLSPVASSFNRLRGDENGEEASTEASEEGEMYVPVEFSLINNEISSSFHKKVVTSFSLGLLRSKVYKTNGAMVALGINDTEYLKGAQVSDLYNKAGYVEGVQYTTIINRAVSLKDAQVSGIYNTAENVTGAQVAGIFNNAEDVHGAQVAGIFNKAKEVKGSQVAGICNYTEKLSKSGAQIGIVNVAKEAEGIQLGLVNYSKNGVFEFGTSYTSDNNIRATLSSGNKHLYTTLGVSGKAKYFFDNSDFAESNMVAMGGLGSRFQIGIIDLDVEGIANFVTYKTDDTENEKKKDDDEEDVNFRAEFFPSARVSASYSPIKHLRLFGGAIFSFEYDGDKEAFDHLDNNLTINAGDLKIHPEFELGVKFSLN
ncbi:MAG: caspase family protein [Treponema sp.]|nr:caspase family protein [Treponema sp.]